MNRYDNRLHILTKEYDELISRENEKILPGNGVFERYKYPILTADHPPLEWRYDFNPETNPYLMERFGIQCRRYQIQREISYYGTSRRA